MFDLLLVVSLGLLEGAGVVMLLPLLALAGVTGNPNSGLGATVEKYIDLSGTALPVVLAIYIAINFGQAWLQRYEVILSSRIRQKFSIDQYIKLYRTITYARWPFFLKIKRSYLSQVVSMELQKVLSGIYQVTELLSAGIISLIQLAIAFLLAPYLTLLILCCGAVFTGCMQFVVKKSREMGTKMYEHGTGIFAEMSEHFNGIKEVKSHGAEQMQVRNFEIKWRKMSEILIDLARLSSKTSMLYKIGLAFFISLFYYLAIEMFRASPSEMIIIYVIFTRLWPRFISFQSGLQALAVLMPAIKAVNDLRTSCLAESERTVSCQPQDRLKLEREMRLRGISFRYAGSENVALSKLDLILPAGTTTAAVGVSGSGKSTLADLILGLMAPESGEISVDNVLLNEANRHLWRQSIGYVSQEAFLFHASIRENLVWFSPWTTEKEMWAALKMAAIDEFVRELPEQLNTMVGDRGIRLSGGERQRIVLARALLRNPALLILDEATSALDSENEKRIQQAIESLRGKLTIFVIAHRISTIRNADHIIVLDKGKIIETGTYQSLQADQNSQFIHLAGL